MEHKIRGNILKVLCEFNELGLRDKLLYLEVDNNQEKLKEFFKSYEKFDYLAVIFLYRLDNLYNYLNKENEISENLKLFWDGKIYFDMEKYDKNELKVLATCAIGWKNERLVNMLEKKDMEKCIVEIVGDVDMVRYSSIFDRGNYFIQALLAIKYKNYEIVASFLRDNGYRLWEDNFRDEMTPNLYKIVCKKLMYHWRPETNGLIFKNIKDEELKKEIVFDALKQGIITKDECGSFYNEEKVKEIKYLDQVVGFHTDERLTFFEKNNIPEEDFEALLPPEDLLLEVIFGERNEFFFNYFKRKYGQGKEYVFDALWNGTHCLSIKEYTRVAMWPELIIISALTKNADLLKYLLTQRKWTEIIMPHFWKYRDNKRIQQFLDLVSDENYLTNNISGRWQG